MISESLIRYVCAAVVLAGLAGSGYAADGNVLVVEQTGVSNNLRVDQTEAQNSLVAGVSESSDFGLSLDPAAEAGSFFVFGDVSGAANSNSSNTLQILDSGAAATQDGIGNNAEISLSGNGSFAGLEQRGDRNDGQIVVSGDSSGGIIVQQGNDNSGSVEVTSDVAFGELIQIGNDNETSFAVTGSPNATVSFTVQGNGTTTNLPASVVTSSGGQITIVQRQLGGFNQ